MYKQKNLKEQQVILPLYLVFALLFLKFGHSSGIYNSKTILENPRVHRRATWTSKRQGNMFRCERLRELHLFISLQKKTIWVEHSPYTVQKEEKSDSWGCCVLDRRCTGWSLKTDKFTLTAKFRFHFGKKNTVNAENLVSFCFFSSSVHGWLCRGDILLEAQVLT